MVLKNEYWVRDRRNVKLPGLIVEQHTSEPNELEFTGSDKHLLCLLLSDGNQQRITRIGSQSSEKDQRRGSFWICPAHTTGTWAWNSTDQSLMFEIDPDVLRRTAEDICESHIDEIELLSTIGTVDLEVNVIAYFFQSELATFGIGRQLYVESLAQLFAVHLIRHYCAPLSAANSDERRRDPLPRCRFSIVLDYIHSHLDKPLSLPQLAKVAGMSQYHFCRLFKQSLGITPYQYVIQQRMEKAKVLLRQRKYTIAEVSLQVGCSDQSRFSRHFKKHVGITPKLFLNGERP